MGFTFGTFVTNMVFGSLIFCVSAAFLGRQESVNKRTLQAVSVCMVLGIVRMLVPVEFFFSRTVGVPVILPYMHTLLKIPLFGGYMNLKELLVLVWVAGSLVKGWKILHKYRNLKKILTAAPVVQSREITQILSEMHLNGQNIRIVKQEGIFPCIAGLRQPVVLLPDMDLSREEMSYILKHELLHYTHHHLWFKMAGELMGILYWWNPIIVILQRQITFITEIKDDMVLTSSMEELQKVKYSQCLVRVAKETGNGKAEFFLGLAENGAGMLKKRILFILGGNGKNKRNGFAVVLLVLALVSNWLIFEPRYPIPAEYQTYDDLKDFVNGVMYKRLFNLSTGEWASDWMRA